MSLQLAATAGVAALRIDASDAVSTHSSTSVSAYSPRSTEDSGSVGGFDSDAAGHMAPPTGNMNGRRYGGVVVGRRKGGVPKHLRSLRELGTSTCA